MTEDQIRKLVDERIASQAQAQHEAAYYSALINVWVNTRFEFDRSLLTLSAGGIALVVTLMTTIGVPNPQIFLAQVLAAGAFIVSVVLLFFVFLGNAKYVEKLWKNEPTSSALKKLDFGALVFFIAGVGILFYVAVMSAATKVPSTKEADLSKTQEITPTGTAGLPTQTGIRPERHKDSVEGIEIFKPKPAPVTPSTPEPVKAPTTQGDGGKKTDTKS